MGCAAEKPYLVTKSKPNETGKTWLKAIVAYKEVNI